MAGLKGQAREPRTDARARRNSQGLASEVDWVGSGSLLTLDGDGLLQLSLKSDGGLANNSGELTIDLDADPGLVLAATGVKVKVAAPILLDTGGVGLDLATDPGLELNSDQLQVKTKTGGGVVRDSDGLSVDATQLSAADTSNKGVVLQAAARADSGQDAVTLTGVSTAVTDPADAPADADALRDDLVANALSEIRTALGNLDTRDGELETAVETLASEFNDLLSKLRTAGVLNT